MLISTPQVNGTIYTAALKNHTVSALFAGQCEMVYAQLKERFWRQLSKHAPKPIKEHKRSCPP
jgi:hypothetical protein